MVVPVTVPEKLEVPDKVPVSEDDKDRLGVAVLVSLKDGNTDRDTPIVRVRVPIAERVVVPEIVLRGERVVVPEIVLRGERVVVPEIVLRGERAAVAEEVPTADRVPVDVLEILAVILFAALRVGIVV